MEKIVKSGDRCTTVTLDGTECAVKFSHEYNYFFVRSRGSDLAVSLESGRGFGDDGVMLCVSGGELSYPHMRGLDTVYLTGTGEADVYAANEGVNPFAKGIAPAEVSGEGDPVVMDGLTGGVPFNEVVISGEDIIGREMRLHVSGKNLLRPQVYENSQVKNNITFTKNDDGSIHIKSDGVITAQTAYWFSHINTDFSLPKGTYFFSASDENADNIRLGVGRINGSTWVGSAMYPLTGAALEFGFSDYDRLALNITVIEGEAVDMTVYPQLEYGSGATAFEPPTGTSYTITPDTNPYVVPTDIYQQEGRNVLFIGDESGATISVNGSRKSKQLAKIYAELEELKTAIITMGGM